MDYLRTLDYAAFEPDKFGSQKLYYGESCRFMVTKVPPGGSGPKLHEHPFCDQVYYVLSGTMHLQLGDDVSVIGPDTVVYIPSGASHRNWNEGPDDEYHIEIFTPGPRPSEPVVRYLDDDEAPRPGGFVREVADVAPRASSREGFRQARLVSGDDGAQRIAVRVGVVDAGKCGPDTHIHPFDQFYYVLESDLSIDIALDKHQVGAGTLVVLPAGVPHRQYNASADTEKHIVLIVPPPTGSSKWDIQVSFSERREAGADR